MHEFRRVFPDVPLKRKDLYTTFTGLRALVGKPGMTSSAISREYEIEELENGLISILGGKYTTFRSLSEKVVNRVLKVLEKEPRYEDTSILSLNGLVQEDEKSLRHRLDYDRRSRFYKLDERTCEYLWRIYGAHTLEIFKLLDYDPDLKEGVLPGRFPLKAEVVYAIKDEMVLTLTDFFRRRSLLFFTPSQGLDLLDAVACVYQDYLHWSDEEIMRQKDAYRQEVEKNRRGLDEISYS
jgi:glycerol-3-phosphate dehydrogenase